MYLYRHLLDHLCDEGDEHAFIALLEYLYSLYQLYHHDEQEQDVLQHVIHTNNENENTHINVHQGKTSRRRHTYDTHSRKNMSSDNDKKDGRIKPDHPKRYDNNDNNDNHDKNDRGNETKTITRKGTQGNQDQRKQSSSSSSSLSPSSVISIHSPPPSVMSDTTRGAGAIGGGSRRRLSSYINHSSNSSHSRKPKIGDAAVPEFAALDFLESIEHGK